MASAFKRHTEKLIHNIPGRLVVNEAPWHDENVGIVMLADKVGYLRNPCKSGTYALVLVECHVYTFSAAADTDTGINLSFLYAFGQCMAEIAVVAAKIAVCTVVFVWISMFLEILDNEFLQWISCVVTCYSNCFYFP